MPMWAWISEWRMLYIRAMSGQNEDETIEQIISHDASERDPGLTLQLRKVNRKQSLQKRCCLVIKSFFYICMLLFRFFRISETWTIFLLIFGILALACLNSYICILLRACVYHKYQPVTVIHFKCWHKEGDGERDGDDTLMNQLKNYECEESSCF